MLTMLRWLWVFTAGGLFCGCGGKESPPVTPTLKPAASRIPQASPPAGDFRRRFVGTWKGASDGAALALNDDGTAAGDIQKGFWKALDDRRMEIDYGDGKPMAYLLSRDGQTLTPLARSTHGRPAQALKRD